MKGHLPYFVTPAQAGVQLRPFNLPQALIWIPAFAGMTGRVSA